MTTVPWRLATLSILFFLIAADAQPTMFGSVHGSIRDAQHRPRAGASVSLRPRAGDWSRTTATAPDGTFTFQAVPIGDYDLTVMAAGLPVAKRSISVTSGAALDVNVDLTMAAVTEQMHVFASEPSIDPRSSTSETTVARSTIAQIPGADRSDSLAMITEFVPGSYIVHDQLHIRGGHQVAWLIDGVPVPNTNIASNVGPQFDPKDIDYLEVQRGGLSSEYGDRTYGVFNVVPRTGFERNREGSVTLSYGSLHSMNDQISLGSHTSRFAYYGSISANRTDAGLQTPVPQILHDDARGTAAFLQLLFLPTDADQLRVAASARANDYDIPNDEQTNALGVRDRERERDAFANLSWVRILAHEALLTVSPFFHYNLADFEGSAASPVQATDHRSSTYAGVQATYAVTIRRDDIRAGVFGFSQHDSTLFAVRSERNVLSQRESPSGAVEALFAESRRDFNSWLTVRAGIRYTRFRGGIQESAASPRIGASARLPWRNAVLRASWGRYDQPPPLSTVSGPLLELAAQQGFGFLPLHGERDTQSEAGITIPAGRWTVDAAAFRTAARNFFDHDVLGESNIFFPLTIDRVHIRGSELTVQSPQTADRPRVHLAYSHQRVEGEGGVVGGLTNFAPPEKRFFLDHDQRDTLNAGVTISRGRGWIGGNVSYGSGFLDANGPAHLPSHTTADLAAGRAWRKWSAKITAINIANRRYLIDNSNTFGGTHQNEPREVSAQVEYRFHY